MSSFGILPYDLRQSKGHFWGKTTSKFGCYIIEVENNVKYIKCNPSEEKKIERLKSDIFNVIIVAIENSVMHVTSENLFFLKK